MHKILFATLLNLLACGLSAQNNPPWRNPLMMAHSVNGIQFQAPGIFQDSAGVPSAIRWKGDTLICAFQWFRQPQNSASWDRVAVKFSFDNGQQWTAPAPIVIDGFPASYQRPFDPTLTVLPDGRLRLYFSSSAGMPPMGLDSTINTYSAVSPDGVHYTFESGARVDHPDKRVIDPAVIWFNNAWHYAAPAGAPQEGAFHYVSPNGLAFDPVINIVSDPMHNWTGNYLVNTDQELRFYGSGPMIWFNTSPNGGVWQGYTSTNLQGGDPTVVKLAANNYLIIYVGPPYTTPAEEIEVSSGFEIFPNSSGHSLFIHPLDPGLNEGTYGIYSIQGQLLQTGAFSGDAQIAITPEADRILVVRIVSGGKVFAKRVVASLW